MITHSRNIALVLAAKLLLGTAYAKGQGTTQPASTLSESDLAALKSRLSQPDADARSQAILELGKTSDPRATQLLMLIAENDPTTIKTIQTTSTLQMLFINGIQCSANQESLTALQSLAMSPAKDQVVPHLASFLSAQIAAMAAYKRQPHAGSHLESHAFVENIAQALGECRDERAVDSLLSVLRTAVVSPLQTPKIRDAVFRNQSQTEACQALAKIGGKKAVDGLVGLLITPQARYLNYDSVASAIVQTQDRAAIRPLVAALGTMRTVPKPPLEKDFTERRKAITETLKGLTGQELGEDADAWSNWLKNNPQDLKSTPATNPSPATSKLTASEMEQRLIKQHRFTYKFAADAPRLMELLPDGKFGVGPGGGKVGGSPSSFEQSWKATEDGIVISGAHGDYTLRMGPNGIMRGRIADLGFDVTLSPKN